MSVWQRMKVNRQGRKGSGDCRQLSLWFVDVLIPASVCCPGILVRNRWSKNRQGYLLLAGELASKDDQTLRLKLLGKGSGHAVEMVSKLHPVTLYKRFKWPLALSLPWTICLLLSLTSASLFSGLPASFVVSQVDASAVSCCPLVLLCPQVTDRPPHFWWACLVALCSWCSSPPAPAEFSCISLWMNDLKDMITDFDYFFSYRWVCSDLSVWLSIYKKTPFMWHTFSLLCELFFFPLTRVKRAGGFVLFWGHPLCSEQTLVQWYFIYLLYLAAIAIHKVNIHGKNIGILRYLIVLVITLT